ncbi:unnamed protein product [Brassicogethes aeneus]|uniref:RING-CH-type domain-containing protein n=1 Tax=Brassicogethes aeneus TaxID=1431903 RepID=A0A9P0AYG1_BRAAE|nr:unnamed protein product [Brassicogethes aeneus]
MPTNTDEAKLHSVTSFSNNSSKIVSVGSTVCRICHTNTANECLISPCNCKGSLAYVHLSCLERWLNQSSRSYCELCMFHYNAVETKRYSFCEGLRLWAKHPRNRAHVKSDLLIAGLLSLVTFGLVGVCFMGMEYFVIEGNKIGIQKKWTKSTICLFLVMIVLGVIAFGKCKDERFAFDVGNQAVCETGSGGFVLQFPLSAA